MAQVNFGEDLVRIHKAMTRGLRVAAEAGDPSGGGDYPPPDLDDGLGRYVRALIVLLHVHHRGEDSIAWPYLRERMPDAPYETLLSQHQTMSDRLDEAEAALETGALHRLHDQLREIDALWAEHIALEEEAFSAGATDAALTPQEQEKLTRRIVRHAQLHSWPPALVVPFTLYNLEPDDRAAMAAMVPSIVTKVFLPYVWKRAWSPMKPYLLADG